MKIMIIMRKCINRKYADQYNSIYSNRRYIMRTITFIFCTILSVITYAESSQEKGLALAKAADTYDKGFKDISADLEMTLRNRKGDESIRNIRSLVLEVDGDGDKSMSIFDDPADVKGTVSLTFSHGLKPDDQWLYLPALKRVKRISSKNKSGPFMGSEFAFEDISSQEVEKYTYNYLRQEPCEQWTCDVLERIPAYKYSGYTKQNVWIEHDNYRVRKVEFYDRKKALLKTLTYSDYKQYKEHYWRASRMEMVNHQTKKSTVLNWKEYRFDTGLSDKDFHRSRIGNIR